MMLWTAHPPARECLDLDGFVQIRCVIQRATKPCFFAPRTRTDSDSYVEHNAARKSSFHYLNIGRNQAVVATRDTPSRRCGWRRCAATPGRSLTPLARSDAPPPVCYSLVPAGARSPRVQQTRDICQTVASPMARTSLKPNKAIISIFSHHGDSQSGRKRSAQAAIGQAPCKPSRLSGLSPRNVRVESASIHLNEPTLVATPLLRPRSAATWWITCSRYTRLDADRPSRLASRLHFMRRRLHPEMEARETDV